MAKQLNRLARELRGYRARAGLRQEEMAEALGISRMTLFRLENCGRPSRLTASAIGKVLQWQPQTVVEMWRAGLPEGRIKAATDPCNALACEIREARAGEALSQEELAERLGISRNSVIRLEAGYCPRTRVAQAVAEWLGLDIGEVKVLWHQRPKGSDVTEPA